MMMWTRLANDDLIRIRIDHEISIVRDHDHLTLQLHCHEETDKLVKNRLRVQILLWLVDQQRSVIVIIKSKVKE